MTVRQAAQHIALRYTLNLEGAPFDIKDAKLLASAGNCIKCPKRTGNQPEIFADTKNADVCTDPDCFAEKKAAHYQRIIVIANKKGIPVLEGEDVDDVIEHNWSREAEFVSADHHLSAFDRVSPLTGMAGTVGKHLAAAALPAPAKYIKDNDGSVEAVYRRTDIQTALEKAGACESKSQRESRIATEATDPKQSTATAKKQQEEAARQKQRQEDEEKAVAISAERVALYRKLRTRAANGLSLPMLRELAKLLIRDWRFECSLPDGLIGDLYSFDRSDDSACTHIDQADATEVQLLIMDALLSDALTVNLHDLDADPTEIETTFLDLVKLEEITASPADIAIERIDLAELKNPSDVYDVIAENIDHLSDVARFIGAGAPHHLGNVEAAANKLGYFYSTDGWNRKELDGALLGTKEAAEAAPTTNRLKLQLKTKVSESEKPSGDAGPVIKIKKHRNVEVSQPAACPIPSGQVRP